MQPMKPERKAALLANRPEAQPADIEEYERLLSLRFTEDPDAQPTMAPTLRAAVPGSNREARISELHRKLFGSAEIPE
jgi:hypothetical protein